MPIETSRDAKRDQVIDGLLSGQKRRIDGFFYSGKSRFLSEISQHLEQLSLKPVSISADDTLANINEKLSALEGLTQELGHGVVLADDFDRILHYHSEGLAIEARLHAACVNSPSAAAIGLVLTTRPNSALSAFGPARGSPLEASLMVTETVPSRAIAGTVEEIHRYGAFAEVVKGHTAREIDRILARIVLTLASELSSSDSEIIRLVADRQSQGRPYVLSSTADRLFPAVIADPTNPSLARVGTAILEQDLLSLTVGSPWPTDIETSASRLAARLGFAPVAYWVDKYWGKSADAAAKFLDKLSHKLLVPLRLNILTSDLAGVGGKFDELERLIKPLLGRWKTLGMQIEIKAMPGADEVRFHDRQLSFERRRDGFELPPFDRIACRTAPGNTSDRHSLVFDLGNLRTVWNRSRHVVGTR